MLSVGPFGFLKEPRPAARRRYRHEVPGGGSGSAAGEEAAIHRALHGRRYADRSVGFVEEPKSALSVRWKDRARQAEPTFGEIQ